MTVAETWVRRLPATWSTGRSLIVLLSACWLSVAASSPASLNGTGSLIALVSLALFVLLGIRTGWLAFAPTRGLDERQIATRGRAYRISFRLLALGVLSMVVLNFLSHLSPDSNVQLGSSLPEALTPRHLLALVGLFLVTPTAVIAWFQAAHEVQGWPVATRDWWPLLFVPAIAITWIAIGVSLPEQLFTSQGMRGSFDLSGATCDHYAAEKTIAGGFGGAMRVGAEVCWDGQRAFVFGDPDIAAPAAVMTEGATMPRLIDLTTCSPSDSDRDFALVSERCTEDIDSDGTMRLRAHGRVSPLPFGLGERQLEIELVVNREGRLLRFG